jgi:DNA-binding response OmpR family regulator
MDKQAVLIVDDEKNIRLTLSQAVESPELEVATAVNGEEALEQLQREHFAVVLLDLKLPGMDGMEVLHWISAHRPDIRVIIITAHGTIDSAVEAMKHGAIDFIQKPFAPREIRAMIARILDRRTLDAQRAQSYDEYLELARKRVNERQFDAAIACVRKALAADPGRPEAFNLLGALLEIQGDAGAAQKHYRAALALDPTYPPALENLYRSTRARPTARIALGEQEKEEEKD